MAIYIFVITFTQFFATIIGLLMSPNWRLMFDWIVFLGIAYFIAMCFMPESPRWLLVTGRVQDGIKALNSIAWFNCSPVRIAEGTVFEEAQEALMLQLQSARTSDVSDVASHGKFMTARTLNEESMQKSLSVAVNEPRQTEPLLQTRNLKQLRKSKTTDIRLKHPLKYTLADIGRALQWKNRGRDICVNSVESQDTYQRSQSAAKAYQYPILLVILIALFFSAD